MVAAQSRSESNQSQTARTATGCRAEGVASRRAIARSMATARLQNVAPVVSGLGDARQQCIGLKAERTVLDKTLPIYSGMGHTMLGTQFSSCGGVEGNAGLDPKVAEAAVSPHRRGLDRATTGSDENVLVPARADKVPQAKSGSDKGLADASAIPSAGIKPGPQETQFQSDASTSRPEPAVNPVGHLETPATAMALAQGSANSAEPGRAQDQCVSARPPIQLRNPAGAKIRTVQGGASGPGATTATPAIVPGPTISKCLVARPLKGVTRKLLKNERGNHEIAALEFNSAATPDVSRGGPWRGAQQYGPHSGGSVASRPSLRRTALSPRESFTENRRAA
jgi:hypothetical protein